MESFAFGRFRLLPERRLLLADEKPVVVSARAFDILEYLVRHHDRVVTRDELVAHVWRGVNVGENNLSVQISNLKRAMACHKDEGLIVNIPGQGYRFVGAMDAPVSVPADIAFHLPSPPSSLRGRLRWRFVAVLACIALAVLVARGMQSMSTKSAALPDLRLTTEIDRFESIDGSDHSLALARLYETEIATHFRRYEDLVITAPGSNAPPTATHFRIVGSVGISGPDTVITLRLLKAPDWREIDAETQTKQTGLPFPVQQSLAIILASGFRAAIFAAEKTFRRGPPNDALDLLIDAHVAVTDLDNPDDLDGAIALLEPRTAHPSNAAKAYLSFLMTQRLLTTPAGDGERLAREAASLIEEVLRTDPLNIVFLSYRALMLASQSRLAEAQETIVHAIARDQTYEYLKQLYGEILLQEGDLDAAAQYIRSDPNLPSDDRLPTLKLAQGDYMAALVLFRNVLNGATPNIATGFTLLLKATTEQRLGLVAAAKKSLVQADLILGPEFSRVSDQRQTNYMLPDDAWQKFNQDLIAIGMRP